MLGVRVARMLLGRELGQIGSGLITMYCQLFVKSMRQTSVEGNRVLGW